MVSLRMVGFRFERRGKMTWFWGIFPHKCKWKDEQYICHGEIHISKYNRVCERCGRRQYQVYKKYGETRYEWIDNINYKKPWEF